MTEENRKENIRAELDRAAEALAAATLLYENGYISDAISRLYYFVLYADEGIDKQNKWRMI